MIGPQIDPGIGVDAGVAGDVLPQVAVTAAANVEARVTVVITQLQGAAVFRHLPPGFTGIGILQTDIRKQAVGERAAFAGEDQRQIVGQLGRPFHPADNGIQILAQRRAADIDPVIVTA